MLRILSMLAMSGTLLASVAAGQTIRPVRVTTPDNVVIMGDYYTVAQTNAPAVMFLHGLNQKRATWTLMAEALQERGVAVLAIDLRGHGESVRRITAYGAQILDASKFTGDDYMAMMMDIESAYAWLEKQPGIDSTRIGLVGTSVSANLAIRYAAINRQLGALVVLSPMLNTGTGLRTDDAIKKIGPMPLRIFVSRHDSFSFSSCDRLIAIRKEQGVTVDNELVVCTGALHGTDMMVGVKKLPNVMVDFLETTLKKPASAPAEESPAPPAPVPPNP